MFISNYSSRVSTNQEEKKYWGENQTWFLTSLALRRGIREVRGNGVGTNRAGVNGAEAEGGLPHLGGCWEIIGWSENTG